MLVDQPELRLRLWLCYPSIAPLPLIDLTSLLVSPPLYAAAACGVDDVCELTGDRTLTRRKTVMTASGHIIAQSVHPVQRLSGSTSLAGLYPLAL